MNVNTFTNQSPRRVARMAGVFYLLLIIFGVFAELVVRQGVLVPGDAAATAANIRAAEGLYRLGFVSDFAMLTCYILLVLALHQLLKGFGRIWSVLMVVCVLISTAIMSFNMINHFAPLLLISGADYLSVFSAEQIDALILFFLEMHGTGYLLAQPTFGLWLLPLGYLGLKSDYFPKFLSYALIVSTVAYLIDFGLVAALPGYTSTISEIVTFPTVIGEFGICLWLLIKGVKNSAQEAAMLEPITV